MPRLLGFVLQPTYRIESGRPVVLLYGRLQDGRSFLVRDRRPRPHFYLETRDLERARPLLRGRRPIDCGRVTLSGQSVSRIDLDQPSDAPPLRDRLAAA